MPFTMFNISSNVISCDTTHKKWSIFLGCYIKHYNIEDISGMGALSILIGYASLDLVWGFPDLSDNIILWEQAIC